VPPGLEAATARLMARALGGESIEPFETRLRARDGAIVDVAICVSPLRTNPSAIAGLVWMASDIGERKRAQADRFRSVAMATDREKLRVARDLHDHLGQDITGLQLGLKALDGATLDAEARATLASLRCLAGQIGEQLHRLAWDLRPTALDDVGLVSTLETHLGEWSQRTRVRADFHHSGALPRGPARLAEVVAYRVIQEALENVARHARAAQVCLLVECHPDMLRLILEDDGCGFDPARIDASVERGLTIMRERAALAGGRVTIETAIGAGTTVFVTLPRLPPRAAPPAGARPNADPAW